MFRMSPLPRLALLACLPLACTACKTVYTDTYSPRRNYFVADAPKKDMSAQEKKLIEQQAQAQAAMATPTVVAPAGAGIPGLDVGAGALPAPADGMAAPAPAPAPTPAVPGL